MTKNLHIFEDNPGVAAAFAEWLAQWLERKDKATIALSGGSTPQLLFQVLSEQYSDRIDWSVVHFFWGDERCVSPDNPESNFGMTRDLLLKNIDIPQSNIHRVRGEANPQAEAPRYGEEIRRRVDPGAEGLPQFDLIILGMGSDGHTASIFPHQMELLTSSKICAIAIHPESGQHRISLTGPVINAAAQVAFLVTGESKQEKVSAILQKQGNYLDYPSAHIHPTSGALHWFLDRAAAAGL
ncbi:MAG: 6-phosphogluconolactonase [Saprospiraceae bacterium]|nr:MAG: 6-phosphogluconolactonase [Saprospiraceae bacterium]